MSGALGDVEVDRSTFLPGNIVFAGGPKPALKDLLGAETEHGPTIITARVRDGSDIRIHDLFTRIDDVAGPTGEEEPRLAVLQPVALRPEDLIRKTKIWEQTGIWPDDVPDPIPTGPTTPPNWRRRSDLADLPVATDRFVVGDDSVYDLPDGSRAVLPRYEFVVDRIGGVDEPRIVVAGVGGVDTLVVTLRPDMHQPAGEPEPRAVPHALAVTLRYRTPVLDGGAVVQELPFPSVRIEADGTVTAALPLTTTGLRQQIVAALGTLAAAPALVVGRGLHVGVPVGTFRDGQTAYLERNPLFEWTPKPNPLILSDEHRARLGGAAGGGGAMAAMRRIRIPFGDRSHPYWQDPARPERFYLVPDRFGLARTTDGSRRPLLRVRATGAADADALRVSLEFQARPVVDPARLEAARPTLAREAAALGSTEPVHVETLPDPQPLLRLALPTGGAGAAALTDRPDTRVDLELGVLHAETFDLADFRIVYDALFGTSLNLLQGEVRVGAAGGTPDDVPLDLRLDRTVGPVLAVDVDPGTATGSPARLTNAIESPVRIDRLSATGAADTRRLSLGVTGVPPGTVLAPGASVPVELVPDASDAPSGITPAAIALDESGVVVEPDRAAIWAASFDARADAALARTVTVKAVPDLFLSPDRPTDKVVSFLVTVERGGTVEVTPDALSATVEVRVPIAPLLTGEPEPPVRYRTETVWQSGGLGESPWRDAVGTILIPIKTIPG